MSPRQALGKRRQAQIYPLLGPETINPYPSLGNGFMPLPSHHGAHPIARPAGGMGTTMGRWGAGAVTTPGKRIQAQGHTPRLLTKAIRGESIPRTASPN